MNADPDDTTNSVEYVAADKPYVSLDAADALVLADGYIPSDIALDPAYAAKFSSLPQHRRRAEAVPGLPARRRRSPTWRPPRLGVQHRRRCRRRSPSATNVLGFVGDFSAIRWGVQRAIGLEVIRYGDPDGRGDLKRNNQVAFRAEVVYGWGVADLNAFAKVMDAV